MPAEDLVNIAGGVMASTGFASIIISWLFCTRPAPRWMRNWLALSWAIVGIRLLTRDSGPVMEGNYLVSLVYIHAGITGSVVCGWNFWAALGPWQDRCPCQVDICKTDRDTPRRK